MIIMKNKMKISHFFLLKEENPDILMPLINIYHMNLRDFHIEQF